MNIIPRLSGPARETGGVFHPALPLGYRGDCPFAAQFPMALSDTPVLTFEADDAIPAEGYRLTVTEGGASITASSRAGYFYGLQTLFRVLAADGEIPCGVFEDAPRYPYRSFMLDVSRHFFPLDEVKKLVDQCARLKLNTFHWHLSDDQGYRIESKRFPRLNEVSSWRDEKGTTVGGFYTQEEIRELVAYADARCVQVVPEIDLPGHTSAITAAYPELCCSGLPGKVEFTQGIYSRILCAGEEKVYAFVKELLEEIVPLFPSPYFHIGGDEAPKAEWKKCPKCQAMMARHGLKDEEELQACFIGRLAEMLEALGKTVIGYNEILASGRMRPSAIAQYWTDRGAEYSAREIPKGRRFIFANVSSFYLDYDPAIVSLQGTYAYDPMIPGGEDVKAEQILGLEAPMWTEHVVSSHRLEELIFPRLAALAENSWSKNKDYRDFLDRLPACYRLWEADGVAVYDWAKSVRPTAFQSARALLQQMRRWFFDAPAETANASLLDIANQLSANPEPASRNPLLSPTFTPEEQKAIGQEFIRLVHLELD